MPAKTRIIPALLLAAMLLPVSARALIDGDYTYTVADNKATITDFNFSYFGALSITNQLGGYPVTSIGDWAFYWCDSLTSVTIPDSVTSIGSTTFCACTSLTSVFFTGDAPTIGPDAFDATPVTIYHLPGATGWDSPVAGLTPVSWNPAFSPDTPPRFAAGRFAFTLTGSANIPVRIEACDSLTSPSWSTVTDTAIPASGTLDFSDPDSSSRPSRFYHFTFPQ